MQPIGRMLAEIAHELMRDAKMDINDLMIYPLNT
jgi:hypothetical protein